MKAQAMSIFVGFIHFFLKKISLGTDTTGFVFVFGLKFIFNLFFF